VTSVIGEPGMIRGPFAGQVTGRFLNKSPSWALDAGSSDISGKAGFVTGSGFIYGDL
jgi:hypothetical protein